MAVELIERAGDFLDRTATVGADTSLTYRQLLSRSAKSAVALLAHFDVADLHGRRVALMSSRGSKYAVAQWAVWRAGGIVVPLCSTHPGPELAHILDDAEVSVIVVGLAHRSQLEELAKARGIEVLTLEALPELGAEREVDGGAVRLPDVAPSRPAMLIYTSGTTGAPKGVISTHEIIEAQVRAMVEAWKWTPEDRVLHVLPLHHVHGVVNVLTCALWAGACCEFAPAFDAHDVLRRFADGPQLSLFMAVPTIYAQLLEALDACDDLAVARTRAACKRMRLMVSGSAALPTSVFKAWQQATGHDLLERYGMTELGMVLGCPLEGERRVGTVGQPFPDVEVRIVDDAGDSVTTGDSGALEVRGPNVFAGYWGADDVTKSAFTADGWFKTGDVAVCEDGYVRLLGRSSVDILKTGGFKVSALEIEEVLREHPAIAHCAVVGVEDEKWGQRVAVAVVLRAHTTLEVAALREWAKQRLAPYKVPSLLTTVAELPCNAMGKVQKPRVAELF